MKTTYAVTILISAEDALGDQAERALLGEMIAQCEENEDHPEVRVFHSEIRWQR